MIQCTPKGLCSWDFLLCGEGQSASIEFNWLNEQGVITTNGQSFDIRKHGVLSGCWSLESNGREHARAQKNSAFRRSFRVLGACGELDLVPLSMFTRSFELKSSDEVLASIKSVHPFTRRSEIQTHSKRPDFQILAFAFWLVAITWRREQQNN